MSAPPAGGAEAAQPKLPQQPISARAGQYYRNTRYIMAALTVLMGFWFGYDGFVRWPAENVIIAGLEKDKKAARDQESFNRAVVELKKHVNHTDTDIRFQIILCFALPPAGILLLIWALYNSRGEYRLAENTLQVPGHPPVPLAAIREVDEHDWDRKGIAIVHYTLSNGQTGSAKLDDFVYDRPPTDDIFDIIKAHMQTETVKPPVV